jgi:hypothetical protein
MLNCFGNPGSYPKKEHGEPIVKILKNGLKVTPEFLLLMLT